MKLWIRDFFIGIGAGIGLSLLSLGWIGLISVSEFFSIMLLIRHAIDPWAAAISIVGLAVCVATGAAVVRLRRREK